MLLGRTIARKSLVSTIKRTNTAVKNFNVDSMSLEEHINKYKTKQTPSSFMNLDSLPELGNPLHNLNPSKGVSLSSDNSLKQLIDLVGPEQVSSHYENFGMSRRVAITFWGVGLTVSYLDNNADVVNSLISAFESFAFYTLLFYVYLEGRKSIILPLLNRFYGLTFRNEIQYLMRDFQENMYYRFREREDKAREQLEYFDLHKEFRQIKNEAVERFLEAEESLLKQHLNQRARNLLETAKQMEVNNQKSITGKVLENIKTEVARLKSNPGQDLINKAFESALEGIKKGKMEYQNDGVIDKVLATTKTEIKKVNDMSESEKNKLLNLSEAQLKTLKDMDSNNQKEFLKKRPAGLDGSLRDNQAYSTIMSQW